MTRTREVAMFMLRGFPLLVAMAVVCPLPAQEERQAFGTSYEALRPAQRKLVDDFVMRLNRTLGSKLEPASSYDGARVSMRTTFDAVTHALLTTKLTDESGASLGTALDLVDSIEEVAGERPGTSGDRQFRVYFLMKPGALEKLEASKEFNREHDNTVYHKGYPTCFRLKGGTPSIQVSLSKDNRRGDVDVDYRSSKLPASMVNGHLRAANSDVRAGKNAEHHDQKWSGFAAWWKNLFNLDAGPAQTGAKPGSAMIPEAPRVTTKQGVDAAMHDFLQAWLVEGKHGDATAYFGARSFACAEQMAQRAGKPIEPGMAKFRVLAALRASSARLGKQAKVSDVTSPVKPPGTNARVKQNAHADEFLLLDVSDEAVKAIDCSSDEAQDPRTLDLPDKRKFGNYSAAALRIPGANNTKQTLYFVWTKEKSAWKIVNVGAIDSGEAELPSLRAAETAAAPKLARIEGDPAAAAAVREFLTSWLVQGDVKKALTYFLPQSRACLEPGQQGAEAMSEYYRALNNPKSISDVVEAVVPNDERFSLVTHANEGDFSLFTGPDAMGEAFLCQNRGVKRPRAAAGSPSGKYYASIFRVKLPASAESTAILTTLWTKEGGQWRIVAWETEAP